MKMITQIDYNSYMRSGQTNIKSNDTVYIEVEFILPINFDLKLLSDSYIVTDIFLFFKGNFFVIFAAEAAMILPLVKTFIKVGSSVVSDLVFVVKVLLYHLCFFIALLAVVFIQLKIIVFGSSY